eukprot:snap_masked-scaffold_2-processed-gene-1.42-mRNA-1 protein AED:1.00 eAED:1.00 QI:0/0/0/0/1/1/2/0/112
MLAATKKYKKKVRFSVMRVLLVPLMLCDPKLSKYIFQINSMRHNEKDIEFNSKLRKYEDDLTDDQYMFIKTLGMANTLISTVILVLHEIFPGSYFEKHLVIRVMRETRDEGK